jgi:hypothetical protein
MSNPSEQIKGAISNAIEALELIVWNRGFEAAANLLDELSNELHNQGQTSEAETLRWAAKELRGENEATS